MGWQSELPELSPEERGRLKLRQLRQWIANPQPGTCDACAGPGPVTRMLDVTDSGLGSILVCESCEDNGPPEDPETLAQYAADNPQNVGLD